MSPCKDITCNFFLFFHSLGPTTRVHKQLLILMTSTLISKESSSTTPREGSFARHSQTLAGIGVQGSLPVEYGAISGVDRVVTVARGGRTLAGIGVQGSLPVEYGAISGVELSLLLGEGGLWLGLGSAGFAPCGIC